MKMPALFHHRRYVPVAGAVSCLLAVASLTVCANAASIKPATPATHATVPVVRSATPTPTPTPPANAKARRLATRINAYISQSRFASAIWGINVVSLDTGRVLYAHNADKLSIPASNTKLFTTALALSTLGSNYHIRTSLYATAAPQHGVIDGDLILYGRGDPMLGTGTDTQTPTGWADHMAAALAKHGVTRVHGSIIADSTYFSGPTIMPGWETRDLQHWWAPPVSALTVQDNMFILKVDPQHGLCCEVSTTPDKVGVNVVNLTQTNPDADYGDLGIYRPLDSRRLYVYGAMQPHAKTRRFALSTPDPALMAGELLQDAMVRHGIHIDGGVHTLQWPRTDDAIGAPDTTVIADVNSPSLADIVHQTLKHSNNLYADLLLLQSGARFERHGNCPDRTDAPRTTLGWGLCAMRAMLRHIGISRGHAKFQEGSGLSRQDLVTPHAITTLLAWVTHQPFAKVYRNALPVAGVDGTLQWRMRHSAASGDVHAKTGTLHYSYTLSGYVTDASGNPLVFSLMLEDYAQPTNAKGHRIDPSPQHDLDALTEMLANFARS